MSPSRRRVLIWAAVIAFVIFISLAFYFELKDRVYEDIRPTSVTYNT